MFFPFFMLPHSVEIYLISLPASVMMMKLCWCWCWCWCDDGHDGQPVDDCDKSNPHSHTCERHTHLPRSFNSYFSLSSLFSNISYRRSPVSIRIFWYERGATQLSAVHAHHSFWTSPHAHHNNISRSIRIVRFIRRFLCSVAIFFTFFYFFFSFLFLFVIAMTVHHHQIEYKYHSFDWGGAGGGGRDTCIY